MEFHPYSNTWGEDDQACGEVQGKLIGAVVKVAGKLGDPGRMGIVAQIHGSAVDARIVTCSDGRRAYGLSKGGVRVCGHGIPRYAPIGQLPRIDRHRRRCRCDKSHKHR